MSGKLFIKKLFIKNFKCFDEQEIIFNVPDGSTEGSGLNILIGENGSGKTTILEAINFVTQNSFSTSNSLDVRDFGNINNEIHIKIETENFNCKMPYPDNYFECAGIEMKAKNRDRKSPGKLLSPQFQVNTQFINKDPKYKNGKGEFAKAIQDFHKLFDTNIIIDGDINTFYFDKNRTRQINTGTFKTTFDRICEDLNWKFTKNLTEGNLVSHSESITGEYFKSITSITNTSAGNKIARELTEFFNNSEYENLKIEFVDLLNPFTNSFFALRKEGELKQIKPKDLGSGIEMVLSLLLLRSIAGESKGTIIYLIDEPELHLHPRAQDKLFELLLEESKTKQIFISTHSPYLFKNSFQKNIGIYILEKDKNNNILVSNASSKAWGKLPWSPSWGEINYFAYKIPTIEFHNELYGIVQENNGKFSIDSMDNFLLTKNILKDKCWVKLSKGNPQPPEDVTLPTYIRHRMHHPENTLNPEFSKEELKQSIDKLLSIL